MHVVSPNSLIMSISLVGLGIQIHFVHSFEPTSGTARRPYFGTVHSEPPKRRSSSASAPMKPKQPVSHQASLPLETNQVVIHNTCAVSRALREASLTKVSRFQTSIDCQNWVSGSEPTYLYQPAHGICVKSGNVVL